MKRSAARLLFFGIPAAALALGCLWLVHEAAAPDALHRAASRGSVWRMRLLIWAGADVDAPAAAPPTSDGLLDRVLRRLGMSSAAPPSWREGDTPLFVAVAGQHGEAARLLLDTGAEVNRGAVTPLLAAAGRDCLPLAMYLVEHGAEVNADAGDGRTPLYYAAENGNAALVRYLLDHGADVKGGGAQEPDSPLACAAMNAHNDNHLAVALLLVARGAPVAGDYYCPLSEAVMSARPQLVRAMIEAGADVNCGTRLSDGTVYTTLTTASNLIEYVTSTRPDDAELHAYREIAAYLRSVGAMTREELAAEARRLPDKRDDP